MKQEDAIWKLHGLVLSLAGEYRNYLPHEGSTDDFGSANQRLSSDTRTRLALIEDTVKKADAIMAGLKEPGVLPKTLSHEQALWNGGQKINAIKAYRERTSEGLAEAYCAFQGMKVEDLRNRGRLGQD